MVLRNARAAIPAIWKPTTVLKSAVTVTEARAAPSQEHQNVPITPNGGTNGYVPAVVNSNALPAFQTVVCELCTSAGNRKETAKKDRKILFLFRVLCYADKQGECDDF